MTTNQRLAIAAARNAAVAIAIANIQVTIDRNSKWTGIISLLAIAVSVTVNGIG